MDKEVPKLDLEIYKPVHILKKLPLDIECVHAYGKLSVLKVDLVKFLSSIFR